ncbi:hypothetical protein TCAL_15161, partial [Tigriopus californicus]
AAGVGSKHHLVLSGWSTCWGEVNLRLQISCGMMVHSCSGLSLGTSLVWNLQVFCGFKSHTSSGTSNKEVMVLSWHSSGPSSVTQPAPQISMGSFSHLVSPTNLPGCFSTGLVDGTALLGSLTIADLLQRTVTFLHLLLNGLLLEGDLAGLFKVLFTNLLLGGFELCYIGVVTFFHIFVRAFKNGILLQSLDSLFVLHATKSGLGVRLAIAKIHSTTLDAILSPLAVKWIDSIGHCQGDNRKDDNKGLKKTCVVSSVSYFLVYNEIEGY